MATVIPESASLIANPVDLDLVGVPRTSRIKDEREKERGMELAPTTARGCALENHLESFLVDLHRLPTIPG